MVAMVGKIKNEIRLSLFLRQVFLVEQVNINIISADPSILVNSYEYKKPIDNGKNRLQDLRTKRLSKYLKGIEYHFYALDKNEWINDSVYISFVREQIVDDLMEKQIQYQKTLEQSKRA
jgi:hypothetical protein